MTKPLKNDLTAEYARSLFFIDRRGRLRWRVKRGKMRAGSLAGVVDHLGYRRVMVDYSNYLAHRLIWLIHHGEWAHSDLDHKGSVEAGDKIGNLRLASVSQNIANSRIRSDNTSGYKGVVRRGSKFHAYIKVARRQRWLGSYATASEASEAYLVAAREAFGEFARAE